MKSLLAAGTCTVLALACAPASADIVTYYVGIDSRTTPFNAPAGVGGGAYPDNPNLNRLTLLLHHGNHYHSIGTYTYSGPAASPTLNDTNANNRLPEISSGMPPINLLEGSGAWAGKYRSGLPSGAIQDVEYGNFEFRNVQSLAVDDPVTFNSSAGRWNKPFDAAHIHLKLVSITPGLNVSFSNSPTSDLAVGGDKHLGDGDEMFSITPTFWVDGPVPIGTTYSAEFILEDEDGAFGNSGRFFVDFRAVPEPASLSLLAIGGLTMLRRRRA